MIALELIKGSYRIFKMMRCSSSFIGKKINKIFNASPRVFILLKNTIIGCIIIIKKVKLIQFILIYHNDYKMFILERMIKNS